MFRRTTLLALVLTLVLASSASAASPRIHLTITFTSCSSVTVDADWTPVPGQALLALRFVDVKTGNFVTGQTLTVGSTDNHAEAVFTSQFADASEYHTFRLTAMLEDEPDNNVLARGSTRMRQLCS